MPTYTMKDVQEADRLLDEMPMYKVSEKLGMTTRTLSRWKSKGLIGTDIEWQGGNRKYSDVTISRVDELYDTLPLSAISEVMEIPYSTLKKWSRKGWVSSDKNWQARGGPGPKANPRLAVEMCVEEGLTQYEAAEKLGVCQSTVSKYIQKYRNGDL